MRGGGAKDQSWRRLRETKESWSLQGNPGMVEEEEGRGE